MTEVTSPVEPQPSSKTHLHQWRTFTQTAVTLCEFCGIRYEDRRKKGPKS